MNDGSNPLHGRSTERPYPELEGWPALIGAAYLPSTVVPVGFTPDALPVGMQIATRHHDDAAAPSHQYAYSARRIAPCAS